MECSQSSLDALIVDKYFGILESCEYVRPASPRELVVLNNGLVLNIGRIIRDVGHIATSDRVCVVLLKTHTSYVIFNEENGWANPL